jgi:thienamycin biosynthesis protein ThnO
LTVGGVVPVASAYGGSDPADEVVPALVGRRPFRNGRVVAVPGVGGSVAGHVILAPRFVQAEMVASAARAGEAVRRIGDDEWIDLLAAAGGSLAARAAAASRLHLRRVSLATGLPEVRVERAVSTLAQDLARIGDVLSAQSPDGSLAAYRTGRAGRPWVWAPAGRHIAVRVPANFPTINIEWLQALAARRPVLLETSRADPFTPVLLARALYDAGVPDGAVSIAHVAAPAFWRLADQGLWAGETDSPPVLDSRRVKRYHNGRSKVLVLEPLPDETWDRLAALAIQGCGRLCTNISGVVVTSRGEEAAFALAKRLAAYEILPLDDPRAFVPAFPDPAVAEAIARALKAAESRGAVDVSGRVTGVPLLVVRDGIRFLRPTVLLVPDGDPLQGTELPFPFVTVVEVPRSKAVEACRGSLVVSVLGGGERVVADICSEPKVDKVFAGRHFDRGYDAADPHEGYLADFLFRKKAVVPAPERLR